MAFNTGNAVGSTDPRDLSDNSENFDRAVNNTASATWTDRLGKTRTSLAGQIGYIGTGTGGAIEDYAVGQELSGYNVIIRYNGEFYRPSASATLPYTTAATTPDADPNLVSIGDANLRQDLSNNTASLGSDLLAHTGTADTVTEALNQRVIYVDAVTDLEALPSPLDGQEAMVSGTPFKYDGVDWKLSGGFVYVESFGASPSLPDNTSAYNALISWVPSGTKVIWAEPEAIYTGNFISESKSLHCDLNGATLTDFTNDSILQIGSLSNVVEYDVTDGALGYGRTTFSVVGASGLFSVGDIGYLWDQAVRPTGGAVNYETIKIKEVSGDLITVDGYLSSYKGASAIKFYHDPNQIKDARIENGFLAASDSHTTFGFAIFNCDNPRTYNLETDNTVGNAIAVRYCFGLEVRDIRPLNPRLTGSGQGYGVGLIGVSCFTVKNVKGRRCRHVYDQDSCYFWDIEDVQDLDAGNNNPVTLAHNGFTSNGECRSVQVSTNNYPVNFSGQGYGGTPSADKNRHPFRNVTVKGVKARAPTKNPNDFYVAVYFQNTIIDSLVDDVKLFHDNTQTILSGADSNIVRVDGICIGQCAFTNLSGNLVAHAVHLEDDGSWGYEVGRVDVRSVFLGESDYPVWVRGRHIVNVDNVKCETAPVSGAVVTLATVAAGSPEGVFVTDNIDPGQLASAIILESDTYDLKGSMPTIGWLCGSSLAVSSGDSIARLNLQNSSKNLRLLPPVGASITLNATTALPPAITDNEEIYISQPISGRGDVVFPAGNNIVSGFTLDEQSTVRLNAEGGKWRLSGKMPTV